MLTALALVSGLRNLLEKLKGLASLSNEIIRCYLIRIFLRRWVDIRVIQEDVFGKGFNSISIQVITRALNFENRKIATRYIPSDYEHGKLAMMLIVAETEIRRNHFPRTPVFIRTEKRTIVRIVPAER